MRRQTLFAAVVTVVLALFIVWQVQDSRAGELSEEIKNGEEQLAEIQSMYDDMQSKIGELELNKENLSDYLASLNQSYDAAQILIDTFRGQIESKQEDIDHISEKLEEAESKRTSQYEAMKLRIQYMYESGDMDIVSALMSEQSIGEILNQVEYIGELLEYDRGKMEDYENLLLTITVMKNQAQLEKDNLEVLKSEQESLATALSELMSEASENIRKHQEQISLAEAEAQQYEKEMEEKKNSIEELKQEESRRIAESISESIRESEEASRRQAALDAGIAYEETTAFEYSTEVNDLLRLAAIIYCEAGGEPYEGQLAVGSVVMNRVASKKYPNTIEGVLMQPYQFTPVGSGRYAIALAKQPNESCLKAATEVLINGVRTGNWLYFRTVNNIIKGDVIGNQVFY